MILIIFRSYFTENTLCASITEVSRLMQFTKVRVVYLEKHMRTLLEHNAEVFGVKLGGIRSNHCASQCEGPT
jgi:hypothetical protein